jgi:cation:H+ antiporter
LISTALVVLTAIKLSKYSEVIAVRTKLGGLFIGTLLLAGVTSVPELSSTVSSLNQGEPNLAAGNMFGSNMFNMFLLAVLNLVYWRERILQRVVLKHALTASLVSMLSVMVLFFVIAKLDLMIGWVGLDSILVVVGYFAAIWLIRMDSMKDSVSTEEEVEQQHLPSLKHALIGFAIASVVLLASTPKLVESCVGIAGVTGLGTGFVGTALLAIVTSLPELVASVASIRAGAHDLAVGNLFGSNLFNLFGIGIADMFYREGHFMAEIDPMFALAALMALMLTTFGLVGNVVRVQRRTVLADLDAWLIVLAYPLGLLLLYTRGIRL